MVNTLLDRGADINATNNNGNTALILAACCGQTETITILLERGDDLPDDKHNIIST